MPRTLFFGVALLAFLVHPDVQAVQLKTQTDFGGSVYLAQAPTDDDFETATTEFAATESATEVDPAVAAAPEPAPCVTICKEEKKSEPSKKPGLLTSLLSLPIDHGLEQLKQKIWP